MTHDSLEERLEFALAISQSAAEFILGFYDSDELEVDLKGDLSPVTAADRGAEERLRASIRDRYPDDGILGEEYGDEPGTSGWRWILDPVDGTRSFVRGVPLFGTLIGVEFEDDVVLGVSRFPALDEVVYAANGMGTWWLKSGEPPRRTSVTSVDSLSDALFCYTDHSSWMELGKWELFESLTRDCGTVRGWGDCYGHILVATGRAEVMIDPELNAWDAAALVPIMREAGGHYCDWNGQPSIYTKNGVSVNDRLRPTILARLADPTE